MALIDTINQYAAAQAQAGDWAGVATVLNDPTTIVKRDATIRDSEYVATTIGRAKYRTFADALAASTDRVIQDNRILLLSKGWNFDSNEVRQIIDDLPISAGIKSDLKGIGRWRISVAQSVYARDVTAQECQSAYTVGTLSAWLNARYQLVASQVQGGVITDMAALKAALGAE